MSLVSIRIHAWGAALTVLTLGYGFGTWAQIPFSDSMVQPPQLSSPERGSLIGQLARVEFGPGDLARGAFTLGSPFSVPTDRGPLLASIFPSYSPENGISEWGIGWQGTVSITRWRPAGDLDFATDDLAGPWGTMKKGTDGYWYPSGMLAHVRVQEAETQLIAFLPDGSRWFFGNEARIQTGRGTYAWYLREIQSATGRFTRIEYDSNDSGRLFTKRVTYGGLREEFPYQIDLVYEFLPQQQERSPFVDYRSGEALVLDRRVQTIRVSARNARTGALQERWHYTLDFQEDPLGPAFFLSQVTQVFASGEAAPPFRYEYFGSSQRLSTEEFRPVPKLDSVIAEFGEDVFQANRGTLLDINYDARIDVEHNRQNTLLVQQDADYRRDRLGPRPPDALEICRSSVDSPANPPRVLAQMISTQDTYQVVALHPNPMHTETTLTLCNREGQLIAERVLLGDFELGRNTRLVDLNRDLQPDLIHVYRGGYEVAPNVSSTDLAFGPTTSGSLQVPGDPFFTPDTTWIHDLNGDGIPDIISRAGSTVAIWFGRGQFTFERDAQVVTFRWADGTRLFTLTGYQFAFIDANKDGLTDLLLTDSSSTYLFINKGSGFREVPYLGRSFFGPQTSRPVAGELVGNGNTEISVTRLGRAYALAIAGPETALLRAANDGKGTILRFAYAKSPPLDGTRARQSVLREVTVESSGYEPVTYNYQYDQPTLHSRGKFLVGFNSIRKLGPVITETGQFFNSDTYSGLLISSIKHDSQSPLVDSFHRREYQDATSFGVVQWKRLKIDTVGWQRVGSEETASERTDYQEYEAELCPKTVQRDTDRGTLVSESSRAALTGWESALHCLQRDLILTGSHPNAALNFRYLGRVTHNSAGQVERVESVGLDDSLTLQELTYGQDALLQQISRPGQGATSFEYESGTRLLSRVTTPELKVLSVLDRDPVTDQVTTLDTNRGELSYQAYFGYDGQERLNKEWNSLGAATEGNPNRTYGYQYASATQPGAVFGSTLVSASGIARQSIEFETAAGEAFVEASLIAEGWSFGALAQRLSAQARTDQKMRPTVPPDVNPLSMDYDAFLTGADTIESSIQSAFGYTANNLLRYHPDVEQRVTTQLTLNGSELIQTALENGTYSTSFTFDAARRARGFEDQAHTRYSYVYDALGRLREVTLPDGKSHRVAFDAHGRPSTIEREGIETIEYAYQPITGLLSGKRILSPSGEAIYQSSIGYDAIGRPTLESYTDLRTRDSQEYRRYYDGATPEDPSAQSARGFLTAVTGDGFAKHLEYRADGLVRQRTITIANWRSLKTSVRYLEDNTIQQMVLTVLDGAGNVLSTSTQDSTREDFGRLFNVSLDGVPWATYQYNSNGQVSGIQFPNGESVSIDYDPLTRSHTATSQRSNRWNASNSHRFNNRGFLAGETTVVGGARSTRVYGYSPPGFLISSEDEQIRYQYGYDPFGLPILIEEDGNQKTLGQIDNALQAGDVTYRFDSIGRTVQRGDLTFTYGPSGQLARASNGTTVWTFVSDEAGNRLAKFVAGTPVAAYFEEGYLESQGLTQPVKVAGSLVGIIEHGAFRLLAADQRGTVTADFDGTVRLASPFGNRAVHPDVSAAVDFVEKGYDSDLGMIRIGVRDYDPAIDRFSTPDPSALESLEFCLKSPVDCNLYSYSRNNPVLYRDPNGRHEEPIHGGATYYLGMMAGLTQEQAARIAIANAGVDHDPATKPTRLGNILDATTYLYHFDRGVVSDIEYQIDRGIPDIDEFGKSLHTFLDVGVPDAPGPHYQGVTNYLPSLFGPLPGGHPWGILEDGTFSWPLSHAADQPFHSPNANLKELKVYYDYLKTAAHALNGDKVISAPDDVVEEFLKTAIDLRTKEQATEFLKQSLDGAPSYLDLAKPWEFFDTSLPEKR